MPKLYIDEFVGITNRLETLSLAFAIRKAYGHEIILDWHELDSFSVEETSRGKVRVLARLGAIRFRNNDGPLFGTLAGKKIILRAPEPAGLSEILDPIYLDVAARIHLDGYLADEIRALFAKVANRPVIGVHIRHGDFRVVDESRYDMTGTEWPAVPLWWYEKTMAAIVSKEKDACFYLSCTGDPGSYESLHKNFDLLTLQVESPYGYKNASNDHRSTAHPIGDLFALACCPVVLATPISGYSHWAANVLGAPATCIVPLPGATPDKPAMGVLRLYGRRLPDWRAAGRSGSAERVSADLEGVDLTQGAVTDWL